MKDFERNMNMLAETESQGRWIVTPRKGTTFVGRRARAQAARANAAAACSWS